MSDVRANELSSIRRLNSAAGSFAGVFSFPVWRRESFAMERVKSSKTLRYFTVSSDTTLAFVAIVPAGFTIKPLPVISYSIGTVRIFF